MVLWTEVATQDVERLAAYLHNESPFRAGQIIDRIISRGESLETSPERGRTPPELREIGDKTWREIQEYPWRIIYKANGKRVEIHAVLDGRRNLEDILLDRILRS